MEKKNFHRTIHVNASAQEAMKKISQIDKWWKNDFTGSAEKLNDRFTVPFGDLNGEKSFVDFVVNAVTPNRKMTWKVADCNLPWFKNKKEWNYTEVIFEILEENNSTKIEFTHVGLVPELECYSDCEIGWNGHVANSLAKFINDGEGMPK